MEKEILKLSAQLGYAYGCAKAAAEYSEGVLTACGDDEETKQAAALSSVANRHAMDKVATEFEGIFED